MGSWLNCLPCFKQNLPTHSPGKQWYTDGPDSPGTAARNRAAELSQDVNTEDLNNATSTKPSKCKPQCFPCIPLNIFLCISRNSTKPTNPSTKSEDPVEDTVDSKASTTTPSDKPADDICI